MQNAQADGSLVLMYHRMGFPSLRSIVRGQYVLPYSLGRQIRMLQSMGYTAAALADVLATKEPDKRYFSVTFDDGYDSVGRLAYPTLALLGVPVTIYVVAGFVGKTNEWDVKIGDCTEKMLSLDKLREMASNGTEIGSHTINHAHLTSLSDADMKRELEDSKKMLEDMFGKAVTGLAYPYGEYDDRVREAVIQAGYSYAVITTRGVFNKSTDPFEIPRINMRWNTFGRLLSRKIASAYSLTPNPLIR